MGAVMQAQHPRLLQRSIWVNHVNLTKKREATKVKMKFDIGLVHGSATRGFIFTRT